MSSSVILLFSMKLICQPRRTGDLCCSVHSCFAIVCDCMHMCICHSYFVICDTDIYKTNAQVFVIFLRRKNIFFIYISVTNDKILKVTHTFKHKLLMAVQEEKFGRNLSFKINSNYLFGQKGGDTSLSVVWAHTHPCLFLSHLWTFAKPLWHHKLKRHSFVGP